MIVKAQQLKYPEDSMASVYLLCTDPSPRDASERLRESAAVDPFDVHSVVEDPVAANIILFAESWKSDVFMHQVISHPLTHKYPSKCYCCCENAKSWPFLPGVYTGVDKWDHLTGRVRTGHYLWMYENNFVDKAPFAKANYLFSFVGNLDTYGIRSEIGKLTHPRAFIRDTSEKSKSVWWDGTESEKARFRSQYSDDLARSKFVLCPRGISPSSVRLFETMKTGRVPVIISDDWVPPEGPQWDSFSVKIKESDIEQIPQRLDQAESRAPAMGARAREAWETWFSPTVSFHRIVEWCLSIENTKHIPEPSGRVLALLQLGRPKYAMEVLRKCATPLKEKLRGFLS